ncbi:MAG: hypothetical protein GEU75_12670 [Dehalococcoidia bacterium]|nr:hypothetical protein [Dehalococcoidia bacterium]
MNLAGFLLWGFVATMVLTLLMAASQGFGLTRINIPFLVGTMLTADRDRAKLLGFAAHLVNGWLFALIYIAAFESWDQATWWLGALIGFVHAAFLLAAVMPIMPSFHARMASEQRGPTPTRQLAPPGFLALNYGHQTPIFIVIGHLVYGGVLGAFYQLT